MGSGQDGGTVRGELVHEVLEEVLGQAARRRHPALALGVATELALFALHSLQNN